MWRSVVRLSVGAVYLQLAQIPGATADRPRYDDVIPWTVKVEHSQDPLAVRLRLLARRLHGLPIANRYKERMLDKWLDEMAESDSVVTYSPAEGFALTHRRKDDAPDSLVRAPKKRERRIGEDNLEEPSGI